MNSVIPISISLLIFVISLPRLLRWIKIARWKKRLAVNKHLKAYNQLFNDVNGFLLSKKARVRGDAFEYLYGEIEFTSFIALLALANPSKETVFLDLGSGVGTAVCACAMVFNVKQSCGVELFEILHNTAQKQQQKLRQMADYYLKAKRIKFINEDFLNTNITSATIIYINATALVGQTWSSLCKRLDKAQANAIIITTTKPLKSPLFSLIHTTRVTMSWGPVNAYLHQRK